MPDRQELEAIAGDALSTATRSRASGPPAGGAWLESARDLLREPDPGPTRFLVEGLIVDQAIAAWVGAHKTSKTWGILETATAIVSGRPAFGTFAVTDPGPVMVILEESGRRALHRRLGQLLRGSNLNPEEALEGFHFAANQRVRLDDPAWQGELIEAAQAIRPRAICFDPLARLKGAERDENSQKEMAPVLDFLRELRDESGSAVVFAHHTGHEGGRLRGTSDLEAYWESKVSVRREPDGVCSLTAEHREAEATEQFGYRLSFHENSQSMRLAPVEDEAPLRHLEELFEHVVRSPGQTPKQIVEAVGRRRADTLGRLAELEEAGRIQRLTEPGGNHLGNHSQSRSGGSGTGRNHKDVVTFHPAPVLRRSATVAPSARGEHPCRHP